MSTAASRVTKPAVWTAWENHVVNDVYPLRRILGTSHHAVVFLTEYRTDHGAERPSDVAIKLVPVDTLRAENRLAQWEAAASIAHPHLARLFDMGRCQLAGREFLFVVTEYAEQTLAQLLRKRALTPDEMQEILPPALDALACLHRNLLVHGQLKPSNILAVNDQLKLSSDTIRPIGDAASGVRTSLYDPPELRERTVATAGDIWALGMMLVEALTQRTWAGFRGQGETTASLLANLPEPFRDTARRCLRRAPADRPTAIELAAQYSPAPQDEVISDDVIEVHLATAAAETTLALEPIEAEATQTEDANEASAEPSILQNLSLANLTLRAVAGALLLFLSVWVILRS
jgi:serine/threonine protein kinase